MPKSKHSTGTADTEDLSSGSTSHARKRAGHSRVKSSETVKRGISKTALVAPAKLPDSITPLGELHYDLETLLRAVSILLQDEMGETIAIVWKKSGHSNLMRAPI